MPNSLKILGHVRLGTCTWCKSKKPKPGTVLEFNGERVLLCRPDLLKFIGFYTQDLTEQDGCSEAEESSDDLGLFERSTNHREAVG